MRRRTALGCVVPVVETVTRVRPAVIATAVGNILVVMMTIREMAVAWQVSHLDGVALMWMHIG